MRLALLEPHGRTRSVVRVGAVAQPDHSRALVEDRLEARRSPTLEVLGTPLEDELSARRGADRGGEDPVPRACRRQVVPVRRDDTGEDVRRKARVRVLEIVGAELEIPVRRGHGRGEGLSVEQDRKRERDRCRAVVAVVAEVGHPGQDRLAGLRRDRVVRKAPRARRRWQSQREGGKKRRQRRDGHGSSRHRRRTIAALRENERGPPMRGPSRVRVSLSPSACRRRASP